MATKRDDGTLNIIFRFRFFLGGINNAFKSDLGFEDFISDQNAETSALVLGDIAMPLLDLCCAAEAGLLGAKEQMSDFEKSLSEKSHEIKFQIELVKRYVDGIERSKSYQISSVQEDPQLQAMKPNFRRLAN